MLKLMHHIELHMVFSEKYKWIFLGYLNESDEYTCHFWDIGKIEKEMPFVTGPVTKDIGPDVFFHGHIGFILVSHGEIGDEILGLHGKAECKDQGVL